MQLLSTKKNKLLLLLPTCLVYVVYIILPILVSLYYLSLIHISEPTRRS